MKKFSPKINSLFLSISITLLTVFFEGFILINSQKLSGSMKTYSGGYPIAWFEYYYPSDVNLSIGYVYQNLIPYYKIELFAFFLNVLVINVIIDLLKELYKILFKNKMKN